MHHNHHTCQKNQADNSKSRLGQKGQTFIEFVLLLSVIMAVSVGLLRVINGNLAEYWKFIVKDVVVRDNSVNIQIQ